MPSVPVDLTIARPAGAGQRFPITGKSLDVLEVPAPFTIVFDNGERLSITAPREGIRRHDCNVLGPITIENDAAGGIAQLFYSTQIDPGRAGKASAAAGPRVLNRWAVDSVGTGVVCVEGDVSATATSSTTAGTSGLSLGYLGTAGADQYSMFRLNQNVTGVLNVNAAASKLWFPRAVVPIQDLFGRATMENAYPERYGFRLRGQALFSLGAATPGLPDAEQPRMQFGFAPARSNSNLGPAVFLEAVAGLGWFITIWQYPHTVITTRYVAPFRLLARERWQIEIGTELAQTYIRAEVGASSAELIPARTAVDLILGGTNEQSVVMTQAFQAPNGITGVMLSCQHLYGQGMTLEAI